MKKPTVQFITAFKDNGCKGRTIKTYSYAALICQIDGSEVKAVRMDYYERKTDVYDIIKREYPGWKLKAIHKLYEEDFEA